jgi:hypothetical protein
MNMRNRATNNDIASVLEIGKEISAIQLSNALYMINVNVSETATRQRLTKLWKCGVMDKVSSNKAIYSIDEAGMIELLKMDAKNTAIKSRSGTKGQRISAANREKQAKVKPVNSNSNGFAWGSQLIKGTAGTTIEMRGV